MTGFFLFLLAFLVLSGITMISGDDRLVLTREGLCFPLFLAPWLRLRRQRNWQEIASVDIPSPGSVRICFTTGGSITLSTHAFTTESLENFLIACDAFGVTIGENAKELRQDMKARNLLAGGISYTELWNNELSQRFQSTAFVPLEPGDVLQEGRINIVRQLAFGGLSAIYLAQEAGRNLLVVKEAVIPAICDELRKEKALELFQREASLLSMLDHPNIAKVFDNFVEKGRHYLLLQHISGQNLRQLVAQEGPQPEEKVLVWTKEIVAILEYLHGQTPPIIHRDLTPENLMLSDDSKITLVDFGAANEFLGTMTGTIVGKQSYIAPEQFRGKPSPSSDIYALGATMFFLLTGVNPKPLHTSDPKTLIDTVSPETSLLVQMCTNSEASMRPANASQLMQMINETTSSRPAALGT